MKNKPHHSTGIYTKWACIVLLALNTVLSSSWAACCARHQGVCGAKCCDGTALSLEAGCGRSYVALPKPPKLVGKAQESISQRLYVWLNRVGIKHVSGTPPHWYRNRYYPNTYPRIQVFDNYGRLLDDTALSKDKVLEERLRTMALNVAENQKKQPAPLLSQTEIKLGMTPQEVKQIWGIPTMRESKIQQNDVVSIWHYRNGNQVVISGTKEKVIEIKQHTAPRDTSSETKPAR